MKNSRAVDTDANQQYIEGLVPGISRDLDLEGLTTECDDPLHETLDMTARYSHLSPEHLRTAVELLDS